LTIGHWSFRGIPSAKARSGKVRSGFPKDHAQTTTQSAMTIHPNLIAL